MPIRKLTSHLDNEDGAVVVIFALILVVLIGFAAFAVDLSGVWVERRHAQTAADVGVLSGAQFTSIDPSASTAEARLAVIDEVKRITAGNLTTADWDTCVDAARPAEFASVAGQTQCISFTPGLVKIRVRVPNQTFDTYFAGVLGVDTLTASAKAVVGGEQYINGDILPFGVPASVSDQTVGCPHDHPNGLYPCDGPDSGNFNNVNISQWGLHEKDDPPGPGKDCNPSNNAFEDNIAYGADHLLGTYPESTLVDEDVCPEPNIGTPPGVIEPGPGNTQSVLAPGLVLGSAGGFPGRLTQTPYTTIGLMGHTLDNEPLWSFIGSSLGTVPDSCRRNSFAGGGDSDWDEDLWVEQGLDPETDDPEYAAGDPASHLEPDASFEHMARCLREYTNGEWDPGDGPAGSPPYNGAGYDGTAFDAPLFTATGEPGTDDEKGIYNLQLSPRWGWSPIGDFGSGASAPFYIDGFKPIFLNTLVDKCVGSGTCKSVWHAGQAPTGNFSNKIRSIVSFQFPDDALPDEVIENGPASETNIEYTLIE